MKLDILAFAAHPDDVELSCAGTLIKHSRDEKKIGVVDLTQGQLGSRGNPALRLEEATKAAEIMGLSVRDNLGMEDGWFSHDEEHIKRIVTAIRRFQPDIVLANAKMDRHPDHGKGASLVDDACFFSGLVKVETEYEGIQQAPWRPKYVLHYIQDRPMKPDLVVDITPYFDAKMEAVMAFRSQFYDPSSEEPETPISSKSFLDFLEARAREMGRQIGVQYGEGFVVNRPLGVDSLLDLF